MSHFPRISDLSVVALAAVLSVPNLYAAPPAPTATGTFAMEDSGFGSLDPTQPTGITVPQIIQKFGERESAFNRARQSYTFRQTVKLNTLEEDTNKVDGEYQQITDIAFGPEGRREEHVVFAPQNTLQRIMMTPSDMQDIEHRLPFVLTAEELPEYEITYLGRQKVDELDTYVFRAGPKTLEKGKRYFEGKVWVDQQDFEIVLINGITVPQDKRKGHEDLSPPYTTYYEQVDGKFWFPTYTKAEGTLHFVGGSGYMSQDVHLKTTVRYSNYRQFRATSKILYNGADITNQPQPQAPEPPKR